jgi:hypothetical protein
MKSSYLSPSACKVCLPAAILHNAAPEWQENLIDLVKDNGGGLSTLGACYA